MRRLQGHERAYAWGSREAIARFVGLAPREHPLAEVWLGAHPQGSAYVTDDPRALIIAPQDTASKAVNPHNVVSSSVAPSSGVVPSSHVEPHSPHSERAVTARACADQMSLLEYVAREPSRFLGEDVLSQWAGDFPFLLKIIAASQPLSLQVHPSRRQAIAGFAQENSKGIPLDSPERNYHDKHHKPEMVYALTDFTGLAGFRTPRRIASVLEGLDSRVAQHMRSLVLTRGVKAAFAWLLSPVQGPDPSEIEELTRVCAVRDPSDSPSPRADAIVAKLGESYPGDPGVAATILLNPVFLRPGEALFIPAGMVHAYTGGLGVEVMASSDNVLRAGLTHKHIDVAELLSLVSVEAAPPMRIAPERISASLSTFYAPVDDFELSVMRLTDANQWESFRSNSGPRICVCTEGAVHIDVEKPEGSTPLLLQRGQAVFIAHCEGDVRVRGWGHVVLAAVP